MKITGKKSLPHILIGFTNFAIGVILLITSITIISTFVDLPFISKVSINFGAINLKVTENYQSSPYARIALILVLANGAVLLYYFRRILKELMNNNLFSEVIANSLKVSFIILIFQGFIKGIYNTLVAMTFVNSDSYKTLDITANIQVVDIGILITAAVLYLIYRVYKEAIIQYEDNRLTI